MVPLLVPVPVLVAAEEEQEAVRSDTGRVRARINEEEA